mgnify:CR=1 FL=1
MSGGQVEELIVRVSGHAAVHGPGNALVLSEEIQCHALVQENGEKVFQRMRKLDGRARAIRDFHARVGNRPFLDDRVLVPIGHVVDQRALGIALGGFIERPGVGVTFGVVKPPAGLEQAA